MNSDSSVSPEQPPEAPSPIPDTGPPPESAVKFTRTASVWSSLIVGFLILIVLLIFITQNLSDAPVTFLGWHYTLPLGVQLLLAAICGGCVPVLGGTAGDFHVPRAREKKSISPP